MSDEEVQLDDYDLGHLRFRVDGCLRSGTFNPIMYVKAGAVKKLIDELDSMRTSIDTTAKTIDEQMNKTFAAQDDALNAWRERAESAEERLAQVQPTDEDLEWHTRIRRSRMQHDDRWYGPMKDVKCNCTECQLGRYTLELLKRIGVGT